MLRNPFFHRQAVTRPEHFFGRGELLRQVTEMIRGGQSCALVGERRIGKSSLLVCLADPRAHHPWLDEKETLLPITLDFLGFREIAAGDMWIEILEALAEAGGVRPSGDPSFTGVRRLLRALTREGARIVLLCDEFELAVENPHLDEGFFGALRSLAASAGVAFVTASRLSLLELDQYRDDATRRKVLGSPFFNIFAEFTVGPFEGIEVAELLEGSLRGQPLRFLTADALFLDRVAGRHPYFLQVAAYHLFECLARSQARDRQKIHGEVSELLSRDSAKVFRNFWLHSQSEERRALALLSAAAEEGAAAGSRERIGDAVLARLEQRGLVRSDGGTCRPFSTLFRDWLLAGPSESGGHLSIEPEG
jgi:hypothetical protein